MTEALRENPERYNIIFNNDNNNDSNHIINKQQDAVLEISNRLSKALIDKLVNQTMATLESQSESDIAAEEEEDIAAAVEETASTEESNITAENTANALECKEEAKPQEDKADNNKLTQDTSTSTEEQTEGGKIVFLLYIIREYSKYT
jgi:hypothetical protein